MIPLSFLSLGCVQEHPVPSCDEVADRVYGEDWELWCPIYYDQIYLYDCGWYDDDDPANFSESEAQLVCEELGDLAEDERCEPEFDAARKCLAGNADDPDECSERWEDLLTCVF